MHFKPCFFFLSFLFVGMLDTRSPHYIFIFGDYTLYLIDFLAMGVAKNPLRRGVGKNLVV